MVVTSGFERIEEAWRQANESPLRELIAELMGLGLIEAIDALAERLHVERAVASLLVFEHGLPEPYPRPG